MLAIQATEIPGAALRSTTEQKLVRPPFSGARRRNFRTHQIYLRQNGGVKEATRQTLIRRSDEPKLEIGETVLIKEGVVGVVLARFTPPGERRNEVHYILELRSADAGFPETGEV